MDRDENVSPDLCGGDSSSHESKLRRRNVTFSNKTEGAETTKLPNGVLSENNTSPKNGILRIPPYEKDTDSPEVEDVAKEPVVNGEHAEAASDESPAEEGGLPNLPSSDARRDSVDSSATTCSNNNNNLYDEMDMDVDEGDFGEEEAEGEDGDYYDDYEYDPYSHEWVPKIKDPESDEDSEAAMLVSKADRDRSLSTIAQVRFISYS